MALIVQCYHMNMSMNCLDVAARLRWAETPWIDQCKYDVYYTFSRDEGRTFRTPVKLNHTPIDGDRFARKLTYTDGGSWPGEYIGMASTEKYAYPIWTDTQGSEGAQGLHSQDREVAEARRTPAANLASRPDVAWAGRALGGF